MKNKHLLSLILVSLSGIAYSAAQIKDYPFIQQLGQDSDICIQCLSTRPTSLNAIKGSPEVRQKKQELCEYLERHIELISLGNGIFNKCVLEDNQEKTITALLDNEEKVNEEVQKLQALKEKLHEQFLVNAATIRHPRHMVRKKPIK